MMAESMIKVMNPAVENIPILSSDAMNIKITTMTRTIIRKIKYTFRIYTNFIE